MVGTFSIDLRPESYRDFYARVGMCVTQYQGVEDALSGMFQAALGGSADRAIAVFDVANGLQGKFAIISAAMLDLPESTRDQWKGIAARVQRAADFRNKVAHGRSTVFGGGVIVKFRSDGEPVSARRKSEPRMQLHKESRSGTTQVIEMDEMQAAYDEMERLWVEMCALIAMVREDRRSIRPVNATGPSG